MDECVTEETVNRKKIIFTKTTEVLYRKKHKGKIKQIK
jgi:hypothetical protein